MAELKLNDMSKSLTLTNMHTLYKCSKQEIDELIKDVVLTDYDFNYVFSNTRHKLIYRNICRIQDKDRREWFSKLLFKLDSL